MIQIPIEHLKETLIKEGLIAEERFTQLLGEAKRMGQNVADFLISQRFITENYFYDLAAKHFGAEKADLANRKIDEETIKKLNEDYARQKRVIVFAQEADGSLDVAMEDPNDLGAIEFLEKNLKAKIKPFLATPDDLNRGFALYGRYLTEDFKKVIEDNIRQGLQGKKSTNIEEAAKEVPIVAI